MRPHPLLSLLPFALVACGPTLLDKPAPMEGDLMTSEVGDDDDAGPDTAPAGDDDDEDDGDDDPPGANVDSDGDGVSDAIELEYGSDPNDPDSDGDGWDDGEEVEGHTNPMSGSDHPYTGGWPIDACRNDLNGTGNGISQVATDFELMDQHGETVRLHDFCGKAVMLVASAMWCGPCQSEAPQLASLYEAYEAEGFIVITLLGENSSGQTPSQRDLEDWADSFGIDHPVVADTGFGVAGRFVSGGTLYLPSTSLLGPGAEVLVRDSYVSDRDVEDALP